MEYAEICLPIWKQGDDVSTAMEIARENGGGILEGLDEFNSHLDDIKLQVTMIKDAIAYFPPSLQEQVSIEGDGHIIGITGPSEIIQSLIAQDLASEADLDCDLNELDDELNDDWDDDDWDDDEIWDDGEGLDFLDDDID